MIIKHILLRIYAPMGRDHRKACPVLRLTRNGFSSSYSSTQMARIMHSLVRVENTHASGGHINSRGQDWPNQLVAHVVDSWLTDVWISLEVFY